MHFDQLRRRDFIAPLDGTVLAWPLAAPRNGIVEIAGPERAPFNEIIARYLKAVGDPREVVSGRPIPTLKQFAVACARWATWRDKISCHLLPLRRRKTRAPGGLGRSLVLEKPDLVLALGAVAPSVKATSTIPIVFLSSADPVQLGLAASLAWPAGNATVVTLLLDDLASKRLELLKEAVPRVKCLYGIRIMPTTNCAKPSARRKTGPRPPIEGPW
jgi:ABC transporter substrate binding protein